jgi:hypothetical protein
MQSSVHEASVESLLIGIGSYVWQSYLPSRHWRRYAPAQKYSDVHGVQGRLRRLRSWPTLNRQQIEYFPTLDNLITPGLRDCQVGSICFGCIFVAMRTCCNERTCSSTELNKTRRCLSLRSTASDVAKRLRRNQRWVFALDTYPPTVMTAGATEIAKDEFQAQRTPFAGCGDRGTQVERVR